MLSKLIPWLGWMDVPGYAVSMFTLGTGKHLFTMMVVKHWSRLLREVVRAPGLSVFKRDLDDVLNKVL